MPHSAPADQRALNISGSRYTHVATLVGLLSGTQYSYQVTGDSMAFNFTFRRNGVPRH